jgi:NDP-sugar pyrophosphorylase family protein
VAPGADVDPTVRIEHSLVAAGARVGAGSSLRDAIVLPGAEIGDGCEVEGSIVMGRVESGARVVDSVIGADGVVSAGSTLASTSVPDPSRV